MMNESYLHYLWKYRLFENELTSDEDEVIKPITENGEVIGIYHKCECGRETRIKFDYDN